MSLPSEQLPRWGLVFVMCPVQLDDAQKLALVREAARAWFERIEEHTFDVAGVRGTLWPSSDVVALGTFTGQKFTAEVHTVEDNGTVEFLVAEKHLQQVWGGAVAEA